MPDWHPQLPPYSLLILGIISFFGAVVSTFTGKTWARGGPMVYRAEDPSTFWWIVVTLYLISLFFLGAYLWEGS
jgi:hypothetical protein